MGGEVISGNVNVFDNKMVAEFKNGRWSLIGELYKERTGHASITVGGLTMIIGGDTDNNDDR